MICSLNSDPCTEHPIVPHIQETDPQYCIAALLTSNVATQLNQITLESDEDACRAVNHFLKSRFPNKTWTSIAILCNPKMELHRDLMNLKGHMNHTVTLGSFSGDEFGWKMKMEMRRRKVKMKTKTRALIGTWHDIHNRPITFDARRFHQVEPHVGHMWALAAYTLRVFL